MHSRYFFRKSIFVIGCMLSMHAGTASAQSQAFMMNDRSSAGQSYFRDFTVRIDMRYDVQASQPPSASRIQRIQFKPGTFETETSDQLAAGATVAYLIEARKGQNLTVDLPDGEPGWVFYRVLNPDGSLLSGEIGAPQIYRGELMQTGDHKIEVINRGGRSQSYNILVNIR